MDDDKAASAASAAQEPRERCLGIARNYEELIGLLRERAEELNISRLTIDEIGGLPAGYSSKLLSLSRLRNYGPLSLNCLLGALGLQLLVIEDQEAFARIKNRLKPKALQAPFSRTRRGLPPLKHAASN